MALNLTHKLKFTAIFLSVTLIFSVLMVYFHGKQDPRIDNIVHILENLYICLVGAIFYAAYFFDRKTYISVAAYCAVLALTVQYGFKHLDEDVIIITICVISLGIFLSEIIYRGARSQQRILTEKHEAEKRATELASRQKSQLLANVSHEIRTPLNGMCGMIHMLKDTPLDKEQSEYLSIMDESSKALMALVNDLLDVSKIEAGKLEFNEDSFSLKELVKDCAKLIQPDLIQKNLSFEATFSPQSDKEVRGDKNRMRQVLLNLMTNAVKFTDQGSVCIHTQMEAIDEDHYRVGISVTDTGIGIAQNRHDTVFDVYSQAHSKVDSGKYGGTGLGLAISKKLIQHMGGNISLESRMSMGSTFKVSLELPKSVSSKEEPSP